VFLVFFFFLVAVPLAHRIVWYGIVGFRMKFGLDATIEPVVSLFNGAINDRGCAIVPMRKCKVVAFSKVHPASGEPRPTNHIRHSRFVLPSLLFSTYLSLPLALVVQPNPTSLFTFLLSS
jgi:hypothetical protein